MDRAPGISARHLDSFSAGCVTTGGPDPEAAVSPRGERRASFLKPIHPLRGYLRLVAWVLGLAALPLALIACGSGPKVASLGQLGSGAEIEAARKAPAPVIRTIAGQTYPGYNGDGKVLAKTQLYWPQDVTIDPTGAIYI